MRNRLAIVVGLVFLAVVLPLQAAEVIVFAAASLTDSLKVIAADYEKNSGDKIIFNFGASSLLARQIKEGAPADVFFSADEARMNALEKDGLILTGSRKSILSNSLVIIIPFDSAFTISSATDFRKPEVKRIALADTKGVPAGVYAKKYLEKQQLWPSMKDKVLPTADVRAALAAVESGNVDAGMVYKTDAAISKKVKVAYEIPIAEGPAISYPVAILKESKKSDSAKQFVTYLETGQAGTVFKKFGFVLAH